MGRLLRMLMCAFALLLQSNSFSHSATITFPSGGSLTFTTSGAAQVTLSLDIDAVFGPFVLNAPFGTIPMTGYSYERQFSLNANDGTQAFNYLAQYQFPGGFACCLGAQQSFQFNISELTTLFIISGGLSNYQLFNMASFNAVVTVEYPDNVHATPLPAAWLLFGGGAAFLGWLGARRRATMRLC